MSCKWRPKPGELVSLWDMLRFHAADFVILMTTLDRAMLNVGNIPHRVAEALGVSAQDPALLRETCAGIWESVSPLLDDVEAVCYRMDLTDPVSLIMGIRDRCSGNAYEIPELQGSLRSLNVLINAQLNNRVFMYVPSERAKYFVENPPPFGEAVQDKFPEATADIVDASGCLGVGRPTAAVYHLMCVVEFGIRHIADDLRVNKAQVEHKTWGEIFGAINDKINHLPNGTSEEKRRKDKFSEAMAHLNHVKNAWRNPTMHSRRRYDQAEAEAIFENVKTFMNYLATEVF